MNGFDVRAMRTLAQEADLRNRVVLADGWTPDVSVLTPQEMRDTMTVAQAEHSFVTGPHCRNYDRCSGILTVADPPGDLCKSCYWERTRR